jgi:2-iminobutanoate/2-iminopropanoate deaminase
MNAAPTPWGWQRNEDGAASKRRLHLVIDNLRRVLAGLSLRLSDVARAGAYLTHFVEDYEVFNRIYGSYFEPGRLPARTCIGVTALARGARVEVDFIARRPAPPRGT